MNKIELAGFLVLFAILRPDSATAGFVEDPKLAQVRMELNPWFKSIDRKLCAHAEFEVLKKLLSAELEENEGVLCYFSLWPDGTVKATRTSQTGGCSNLGQAALSFIRAAAPFTHGPDLIGYPKDVLIRFRKSNGTIDLKSQLHYLPLRGRIGEKQPPLPPPCHERISARSD